MWEIGNEVYGAKSSAGPRCASFGWEDAWTCDGTDYVAGSDQHDGFLAIRDAMRAVDPTIQVGAVGLGGRRTDWNNFGNKVIDGAGTSLDFYVVHDYGFGAPASAQDVVKRPVQSWSDTMHRVRSALDSKNGDRTVPVAVTEYNIFSVGGADNGALMSAAVDALYVADTIGQMGATGVSTAALWNLMNGATQSGSDYGMLDPDTMAVHPSFFATLLWSRFGDQFLPASVGFDEATVLSAYAGKKSDGTLTLLVLNKSPEAISAPVKIDGGAATYSGTVDAVVASDLTSADLTFNGHQGDLDDPSAFPGQSISVASTFDQTFAPNSLTLLSLRPSGS